LRSQDSLTRSRDDVDGESVEEPDLLAWTNGPVESFATSTTSGGRQEALERPGSSRAKV